MHMLLPIASPQPMPVDEDRHQVTSPLEEEYDFVEKPLFDVFCPVLFGVMLEPHFLDCCGKHLSAEAAIKIQEYGQACPLCRKLPFTSHPDQYLCNTISELQVYCPDRKRECEWVGELPKRDRHRQFRLCPLKYDFVEEPPNDMVCPVLRSVMLEPYQTDCCKRHLSAEVATDLARRGGGCPLCGKPGFTNRPDQHFRRIIRELQVHCPHRRRGCEWVGGLSDMDRHVESCPRKNSPLETDLAQLSQ